MSGVGHLTSQCSSQNKTLLVEIQIEDLEEDSLELVVHQQDDDSDASAKEREFNGCIRTMKVTNLTPNADRAQLRVVRCTLAQLEQINDWRRTIILQTCTKLKNKRYKVIEDSGSCINTVASKLITTFEMKLVKHPNLYKITWIELHP